MRGAPHQGRDQPSVGKLVREVVFVVLVVALVAMGYQAFQMYQERSKVQKAAIEAVLSPSANPTVIPSSALAPVPKKKGRVRQVAIPRLGIKADVVPLELAGATLTPPADADLMGWWKAGAKPGSGKGAVLVVGHTLHWGGGVLNRLGDTQQGDQIVVRTPHSTFKYVVRSVRHLTKAQVAARSKGLFKQDGPEKLVVVTCDNWNGQEFLGNTVVVADPL